MMHLYTIFGCENSDKDGLYYDPVGDEVFVATFLRMEFSPLLSCLVPIYRVDHGDELQEGILKDHGYNVFLGTV